MPSMIEVSPDVAAMLAAQADAEGMTIDGYLKSLVEEKERTATIAAIREGLAEAERGEGKPASEVFAEMCQKYDLPDRLPVR